MTITNLNTLAATTDSPILRAMLSAPSYKLNDGKGVIEDLIASAKAFLEKTLVTDSLYDYEIEEKKEDFLRQSTAAMEEAEKLGYKNLNGIRVGIYYIQFDGLAMCYRIMY